MRYFFTDGACSGNPGPGGFAVIETKRTKDKEIYILYNKYQPCDNTTNNREELKAIIHVFENFYNNDDDIAIFSDSAYCVNMLNKWIWNWAERNWKDSKNREVENIDLVKTAYFYLTNYPNKFFIEKVNGHSGIIENEIADAIASCNKQKYITLCRKHNIKEYIALYQKHNIEDF
jgi:ribonuclease HI